VDRFCDIGKPKGFGLLFPHQLTRWLAFLYPAVGVLLSSSVAFAQSQLENATTFTQFRPRREIPGERFVGREVCAGCHGQRNRTQSHTSMAQALHSATGSSVLRSHSRMTFRSGLYSYEIVGNGDQSLYRVTDGKETISEAILYAFGNAHIAQTYVFRHNGKLYEGRVSYYSAIAGLDWTIGDVLNPPPSLEEAAGRDISGDEARNCFSCHGTAATVDHKLRLEGLVAGVSCEACHGPGGKHVAAMNSGAGENLYIFNPKTLEPEALSQEFCGACHRSVDMVAMMPDLGGLNNIRFQPYRIFNSRGHDPNDRRLACTACHDPHVDLKQEDSSYDSKCTTCHLPRSANPAGKQESGSGSKPASAARTCPVANERCVSCHMPKVELAGAHFQFTDHRIRIVKPGETYPY